MRDNQLKAKTALGNLGGPVQESAGCDVAYVPTIEEKLNRMESNANDMIRHANSELEKVTRIRAALKKNPALSDLYTLMRF